MKRTSLYRMTALLLALTMCLSAALAEGSMTEALLSGMAEDAVRYVKLGDVDLNIYQNARAVEAYKAMPSSFDLRDYGYVPPVRSQGNWGTCWGFASIAASEISILSKLNMTCEEFEKAYGKEMNLSEKHLAWFGTSHLPLLQEGEEYIYPTLEEQAGEGIWQRDEATEGQVAHYNNGGFMTYSSGVFAAGMGPNFEAAFPYQASDGTSSTAADWSLDDMTRFNLAFELEHSAILPTPAQRDENGNYVYSSLGTAAIKDELLNGRAVTIAYHADQAIDPDARRQLICDRIKQMGFGDEDAIFLTQVNMGEVARDALTEEQMRLIIRLNLVIQGASLEEITEEDVDAYLAARAAAKEQAAAEDEDAEAVEDPSGTADADALERARQAAAELGLDYDQYLADMQRIIDASEGCYINTDNYAQYTDDQDATADHAVTIIGWDDSFAASNFLEGHQPPADGAWIVRNSWGEGYGNDGYFYLSYYDKTICAPESFEFVVSDLGKRTMQVDIMGYDYMQAVTVPSVHLDERTGIANIFELKTDSVIRYVSVLTADIDTDVNVGVYLLHEDAKSPTDGVMLDFVSTNYLYAGYHRIDLNYDFAIPAGSRISIVQQQRVHTDQGRQYVVPYTAAPNRKYMELQNLFALSEDYQTKVWTEGCIGKGESFVSLDGEWKDWNDVIAALQDASTAATYMSYDNLSMKLYAYPKDEVIALHEMGRVIDFNGASIRICEDCGYTLVEQ